MNHFGSFTAFSVLLALGAVACGSSDPTANDKNAQAQAKTTNPCGLHTSFPGDENCILPPDDGKGFQIHVGPADYDNPDPQWIVEPGQEPFECYHLKTPNTGTVMYFEQQYRMRPGSHHMIILKSDGSQPDGWGPCTTQLIAALGGTQHIVEDFPPNLEMAPEDQGLAHTIDANTPLEIQLHSYNATDRPNLREFWVNFIAMDPSTVTAPLGMLGGFANVSIAPHTSGTAGGTCDYADAFPPGGSTSVRIVDLFAHAHYHNKRFAIYKESSDGSNSELVYDSYAGPEAPTYLYNSVVQNPAPDPTNKVTGATSGALELHAGERLRWECDITNDLNITLNGYAEQVYTAEMCNVFGSMVGAGFPCFKLN
jgi:hypothetical protein